MANDTHMNMEVAANRELHARTLLAFCCGALSGATLGILVAPARGPTPATSEPTSCDAVQDARAAFERARKEAGRH